MKKITVIIAIAAISALFVLSACQKGEAPKQAPATAPTSTMSAPTATMSAPTPTAAAPAAHK